jgi:uncharacterized damage-inducible protein DinB
MTETALLLQLLDEAYDRRAWHGTNLRGSIRRLSVGEAAFRPKTGRHNIWELMVHAAYWKYAVRRQLLGEKRGSFPLKGSNWFRRPEKATVSAWKADVSLLEEAHRRLREAVEGFDSRDLRKRPRGSKFDNASLILGVASHDLYHAGQIQLLKKLARR